MSFNAGELVATIRLGGDAEVARKLDGVKGKLNEADGAFSRVKAAGASAFSGASLAAAALAVTTAGVTVSLVKQGAAYNTLQQTSRAALNTLLGGAEAANAQMDKLDDFASNSPFSKSVFIQAQQQLLGFGVEAAKVIPTLDAIQNAVAAVGGSNEQIAEITSIMAKIQSSAKITAEDLNQFGERGLDAATLIGNGMGKTAAQIRDDITKGMLDAGEALDVLTEQMATKFAGASANVKNTAAGTADRIRAASRDIGAALAAPFIDPNGGGLAVTWGNQLADVMRAVQRETSPVVDFLMVQARPAIEDITDSLTRAKFSVEGFSVSDLEAGIGLLSAHAPAVGALSGAILASNSAMLSQIPILGNLVPKIHPLAGAFLGAAAASPELRSALVDVFGALAPLLPVVGDVAQALSGSLVAGGEGAARVLNAAVPVIETVSGAIASLPTPVLLAVGAFAALKAATGTSMWTSMVSGVQKAGTNLSSFATQTTIVGRAAAAQGKELGTFGAAATVAGGKFSGAIRTMGTALLGNPIGLALGAISLAVGVWSAANAEAQEKVSKHKELLGQFRSEIDLTTGTLTQAGQSQLLDGLISDGTADKLKLTGVALSDFVEGLTDASGKSTAAEDALIKMQLGLVKSETGLRGTQKTADALGVSMETLTKAAHGSADAQAEVDKAMKGSNYEASYLSNTLGILREQGVNNEMLESFYAQQAAIRAAKEAAESYDEEMRALRESGGEAAVTQRQFEEALSVVRDTASDAETRISALSRAIDILNGGTMNAAEQQIALQDAITTLESAFTAGTDGVEGYSNALVNMDGTINVTSEAGERLHKALSETSRAGQLAADSAYQQAVAMGDQEGAADAAAAAMQPYVEQLKAQGVEAGLSADQINGMIENYGLMPEVVATMLDTGGTISLADYEVLSLLEKLNRVPPNTEVKTTALTADAVAQLEALGVKVTTLPDGTVTASADTGVAENALNDVARSRTAYITVVTSGGNSYSTSPYGNGSQNFEADGGMYAHGVKHFANGEFHAPLPAGTVKPGIYPGGADIVHFAEPETRWEAYISGKAGMERRNRGILAEAARRLDMQVVPRGARTQAHADGAFVGSAATSPAAALAAAAPASVVVNQHNTYNTVPNDTAEDIKRDQRTDLVRALRGRRG